MTIAGEHVLWDVIEEHFGEAADLLEQWTVELDGPSYRAGELARTLEARCIAHVDALALGGLPVADALLWPALGPEVEEPERIAAAVHALAIEPGEGAIDRLLGIAVETPLGPVREGIVEALAAHPRSDLGARALAWAERVDDAGRAPCVAIAAARSVALGSVVGAWIGRAAAGEDLVARRIAARACVLLPRAQALYVAESLLDHEDEEVRRSSLGAALIHGSTFAHECVVGIATGRRAAGAAVRRACMTWIGSLGEPQHVERLVAALEQEDTRADAIWALGFSGRVAAVEALLPWLSDEDLGGLAGEAIAGIAGLDRDDPSLWQEPSPQPPVEDADIDEPLPEEDLDVAIDGAPEDELPRPNAEAFGRAWAARRLQLDARGRFFEGQTLRLGSDYATVLARASSRRRHAIAFEIAMRTRGAITIPTRAFSALQRPAIARLEGLGALDGALPFTRIS